MRKIQFLLILSLMVTAVSAKKKDRWQSLFNGKDLTGWHQLNGQARYNSEKGPTAFVVNVLPNTLSQAEKEQGWTLLFDGKTTKGWKGVGMNQFPSSGWKVEDASLMVIANPSETAGQGVDIISDEKYSAFDFQFEFNYAEGANSGVKYFTGNGGPSIGLEYQIIDDKRHPDAKLGVVGNRALASLYDLIPADKQERFVKPAGEWNIGRIVVYPDNRVEHWLNGIKVVEYVRGSGIYKALVARSKYEGFDQFGMVREAPILLQYHFDQVKFRSLKIKKL